MAVVAMMTTMMLTSCSKDDDDNGVVPTPEESVVLNCAKPDYPTKEDFLFNEDEY